MWREAQPVADSVHVMAVEYGEIGACRPVGCGAIRCSGAVKSEELVAQLLRGCVSRLVASSAPLSSVASSLSAASIASTPVQLAALNRLVRAPWLTRFA